MHYIKTRQELDEEITKETILKETMIWESRIRTLRTMAASFLALEFYDLAFQMKRPLEKASENLARLYIAGYLTGCQDIDGMYQAFKLYPKIQIEENFIIPTGLAALAEDARQLPLDFHVLQIEIEKGFVDRINEVFKELLKNRKELGSFIE